MININRNILVVAGIFVSVMIFSLSYTGYHYFKQESALKQKVNQVIVDERKDLGNLQKQTEEQLSNIGFRSDEIEMLYRIGEDKLPLNKWLPVILDESDMMETVELYEYKTIQQEANPFVRIYAEPVETVYLEDKETVVTKVHYSANVNKPILFQKEDYFEIVFNTTGDRLFGYTKLHYVSSSGESIEDYVVPGSTLNEVYPNDFQLAFKTRKRIDGEWFYFTGLSGIHVAEVKDALIFHSQYTHKRLSGNQVTKLNPYWKISE